VIGQAAVIRSRLERLGSRSVIVTVDVHDDDLTGVANPIRALDELPRAATGIVSFSRIPRKASKAGNLIDQGPATMTTAGVDRLEPPPVTPLLERIGIATIDGPRGIVEIEPADYIRNSFGAINGGVIGMLAQAAAEAAVPHMAATDAQIHYLAQASQGAVRASTTILRSRPEHVVALVNIHESTDPQRTLSRATITLQPRHGT
jgi:acyl-coenzyme A thioesterase PaaI-like protein